MDAFVTTIMYYLGYTLAVFGLVFCLILLVRLVLWCLMCDLKHSPRKSRLIKAKVKKSASTKDVEAAIPIPEPPTLRRSPNVQRLNLIKPEDELQFKEGRSKSKLSVSSKNSDGSEHHTPPALPPKDIEKQNEVTQQSSDDPGPLYASLTFPKRLVSMIEPTPPTPPAPPPTAATVITPSKPACICPFCKVINKTAVKPVDHSQLDPQQQGEDQLEQFQPQTEPESEPHTQPEIKVLSAPELISKLPNPDNNIVDTEQTTEKSGKIEFIEVANETEEKDIEKIIAEPNQLIRTSSDEFVVIVDNVSTEVTTEIEVELPIEERPLPRTPSPDELKLQSSSRSPSILSIQSLAIQNALDSLDQVISDLNSVVTEEESLKPESKHKTSEQPSEGTNVQSTQSEVAKPEESVLQTESEPDVIEGNDTTDEKQDQKEDLKTELIIQNVQVVTVDVHEPSESIVPVEKKLLEELGQTVEQIEPVIPDESNQTVEQVEPEVQKEADQVVSQVEQEVVSEPNQTVTEQQFPDTETEQTPAINPSNEAIKASTETSVGVDEPEFATVRRHLRKIRVIDPTDDEVIASVPPRPLSVKLDDASRRKSASPRIVQSVLKAKPTLPAKPAKKAVFRTKSLPPPVLNSNGEPLSQCMIYAQVIDQIKQRQQQTSEPSLVDQSGAKPDSPPTSAAAVEVTQ